MNKILYFEYIISLLVQWYELERPDFKGQALASFTRLRSLKLLFLVSAADANDKDNNDGLLDIFDSFYAMQHGPVEGDIYNAMVLNKTSVYKFGGKDTTKKATSADPFTEISEDIKTRLNNAVKSLKDKNSKIVTYKPFDLVDITHKWSSWQVAYKMAQFIGKGSEIMPKESIKKDYKYFH